MTLRSTASQCFYIIIYMYVRLLENLKAAKIKISPSPGKPKNIRFCMLYNNFAFSGDHFIAMMKTTL